MHDLLYKEKPKIKNKSVFGEDFLELGEGEKKNQNLIEFEDKKEINLLDINDTNTVHKEPVVSYMSLSQKTNLEEIDIFGEPKKSPLGSLDLLGNPSGYENPLSSNPSVPAPKTLDSNHFPSAFQPISPK